MKWILLFFSVAMGASKSVLSRVVGTNGKGVKETLLLNVKLFAFALIPILPFAVFGGNYSVPWGLATAYGVCVLMSQICLMRAVSLGPVSVSSLFYSCGFLMKIRT